MFSLVVQADGKILVGGGFSTLGGQPRNYLDRLNADGTADVGFNPAPNNWVYSLAVQVDGKILVGGGFSTLGGQPRYRLGRLNVNGSLDTGFNPGFGSYYSGAAAAYSLVVQVDGKILVGGRFTTLGGQKRTNLGRLNADGTLDSFNPEVSASYYHEVRSLVVPADGKILVGGSFTTLGGQPRNYLGRLNADGKLDSTFNPGANNPVNELVFQNDKKILVGGSFTTLGGQSRMGLARLNNPYIDGRIDSPRRSGAILAGDVLRFSATGLFLVESFQTRYQWSLGSGRVSTLEDPGLVSFPSPGSNDVTFKLVDSSGAEDNTPDARSIVVVPNSGFTPDLAVIQVDVPAQFDLTTPAPIRYVVQNVGNAPLFTNSWKDALYLSADPYLDVTDQLLASGVISNPVPPGEFYTNELITVTTTTTNLSAAYLILSTDDEWQVLERHQLNNEVAHATDLFTLRLTNGAPYTGIFTTSGEFRYFRIDVPAGQILFLRLNAADHQGINGLYVRRGALPTRQVFDFAGAQGGLANQQVLIPAAGPGTYYVMVYGEFVPGNGAFTLEPLVAGLHVVEISPTRYSQHAAVSLSLAGAGFDGTTSVELVGPGGTYPTTSVNADSFTHLTAGFDLWSVPLGWYSVRVSSPSGESSLLASAFEVLPASPAAFQTKLTLPFALGRHAPTTFFVEYSNTGGTTMRAPLLAVSSADPDGSDRPLLALDKNRVAGGLWASGLPQGFAHEVRFRAGANGTGWLQPGESGRVSVYYAGLQLPWDFSDNQIEFRLGVLTDTNATPVDWSSYKNRLRPAYMRSDAWEVVWNNFVTQTGPTWGNYTRMLNQNADYLSRIGAKTQDDELLQAMEIRKADGLSPLAYLAEGGDASAPAPGMPLVFRRAHGQPISRRYAVGPLGRGWTHNWQLGLQRDTNGVVRISDMTGTPRLFQPDIRYAGKYIAAPGDLGALEDQGGGFLLREPDGGSVHFHPDGRLDSIGDSNGNRITCGYHANQLTSLNHSAGHSLRLGYNAAGRIQSVTDPYGRTNTFTYDAAGEHLVGVQAPDRRRVTYGYHLGQGTAREHALREIGYPDGSHRYYGYDERGRLTGTWRDGNAEPVEFLYDSTGEVSVRDVNGHTNKTSLDYRNQTLKTENPLGQSVRISLDDISNLSSITDPAGRSVAFAYDSSGRMKRSIDPLGQTTEFAYGALNRVASATDAIGRQTQFSYDSRGNPTHIRYADGQRESWAYDPQGRLESWTSRRGHQVRFTYDNAGRITSKTYPDGTQATYVYDAHGNLTSFTDATGTTALTFDSDDYLTKITYPAGQWLAFTYDAAGRRATSLDQRGHRLDYHYGALGRLESLADETGATLVHYAYDPAGRPSRKTLGNGVYATYGYEAAGRLLSVTNWAPAGALLSRFAFTYDSRDRRTSMATHYGSWTYDYDDAGQLVHAALASTATNISNQDLTYVYDAVGNRVRTISNGATSEYHVNAMNRYEQVGPATRLYDAAGNLIHETALGAVTAYEYDTENRLSRVTRVRNGTTDVWEYAHNALGQRVATTHNGVTTRFVIDPLGLGNVVGEYDAAGSLKAHYDHAAGLVARAVGGGGSTFYTADPMGNVAELTGNAGSVLESRSYSPSGVALSGMVESENPFWFAGEFGATIEGHGLVSVRARYLDPNTGRFVQEDPLGIGAGLNYYTYANNNPLSFVDVSGLSPRDCKTLQGAAGAIGGLSSVVTGAGAIAVLGSNPVGWAVTATLVLSGVFDYASGIIAVATADDTPAAQQTTAGLVSDDGKRPSSSVLDYVTDVGRKAAKLRKGAVAQATDVALGYVLKEYCAPKTDPTKSTEPPTDQLDEMASDIPNALDPNRMLGPAGVGAANYITGTEVLPYQIDFENDTNATAPAQVVVITAPLSPGLDWGSVELTDLGFGDQMIAVAPGSQFFATNLLVEILGVTVVVEIEAGIRPGSGEFYTVFRTMDPSTGWTPPVNIGFLPPEDGTGRGRGHVAFIVKPKANLATGTQIRSVARISFDFQPEIATNQRDPHNPGAGTDPTKECLVTIDAGAPASHALPLPGQSGRTIPVVWTGQDDAGGSGIAFYDVYVTSDSTIWTRWLERTTATRGMFRGELGRTYSFFTLATDNVGNRETNALSAHATTTVATNVPFLAGLSDAAANVGSSFAFTNGVTGGPSGSYRFWLGTGAPSGAEVNPTNGVLRWTPSCSQASRSHSITVWVADSANTNLMDATTFTVNVGECVVPSLGRLVLLAGDNGRVPVNLISTVPLTNLAMTVEAAAGRLTNLWIEPIVSQICTSTIAPTLSNAVPGSDVFDLSLTTCSNLFLIGTQQVAWLHFTAVSNRPSAFVNLKLDNITGWQADGTAVRNFAPQSGRLVIIGEEPLLECLLATNSLPSLVLYGKAGWNCEVQSRPALGAGTPWQFHLQQTMADLFQSFDLVPATNRTQFFRALRQ